MGGCLVGVRRGRRGGSGGGVFLKKKTAYEREYGRGGSERGIRDRLENGYLHISRKTAMAWRDLMVLVFMNMKIRGKVGIRIGILAFTISAKTQFVNF